MNKLALGTVQFGMPYGVANKSGKISFEEASNIITLAKQNHVNTLDTAIAYGDSEQVLGQIGVHDFQVITKLPVFPDDHNDLAARVENIVCNSIETLKKDSLYGFLFHSSDELLGPSGESLYAALDSLKSEGLIKKLGVSIYAPSELDLVLKKFDIDLVQVPVNIFDRSLELTGLGYELKDRGIEVHARSVFLQGLLLMDPKDRPMKFSKWKKEFDALDKWLTSNCKTPLEVTLKYVEQLTFVDKLVVGVDSKKHLEQIFQALSSEYVATPVFFDNKDNRLINPSKWDEL